VGMISFLHSLLFVQHKSPASPNPVPTQREQESRSILSKCGALSEAEIDAYMAYETEGIVYEEVPLDYDCPGEGFSYLYADGVLQVKVHRRHTNQISPETLAKVQQVLQELSCPVPP